MESSMIEAGARSFVVNFLQDYIATGTLILIEDGGTVFTFEGTRKKSSLKVSLEVHNPRFYWKIFTKASLGLADAYIHGDFSVIDKNEGLLNMLMLFSSRFSKRRWWTPMFLTASAKYFYNYVVYGVREWWIPVVQTAPAKYFYNVMRKYTVTQADGNISDEHYDLACESSLIILIPPS
ncbi:uncharacterized protein LOC143588182 [Bidens hawaiensis]|uniref:uncharacterized protein LOC143588182 n=1 Tax=Bidens hawaiensis TaxID=980011 RepID=UPI00404A6ACD